jgi:hypothetical protein
MRKIAPLFITTSILAFAAGNVMAGSTTVSTDDKTGSPTVDNNTNAQPLSYSDKSNTAKGTNARMNGKSTVTTDTSVNGKTATEPDYVAGEDKKDLDHATTTKAKKSKKVASDTRYREGVASGTTSSGLPDAKPSPSSDSTPLSATQGEKANSITGKSAQ